MKNHPAVSVTVVAYNSADHLPICLQSIRPTVLNGFAELLVVDNASPDESAALVAREFPEAKLIRSEVNRGFAGGCNLAWSQARGRYWLLLNPDVTVPADGLRQLVEWMDEHPELGAASPELMDGAGGAWYPGRSFPSVALTLRFFGNRCKMAQDIAVTKSQ